VKKPEYKPKLRDEVYRNMSAIRSSENRTETLLSRALHGMGLRYRKYAAHLPGKPDVVFPRVRVVVFVDGDYWHARELAEGKGRALKRRLMRLSEESQSYWLDKFGRRIERDRAVTKDLEGSGWLVLRYWESDVRRDIDGTAAAIARIVRRRKRRMAQL